MNPVPTDTPALTDAAAKEATGKTLQQWWKALDAQGGVAKGRRELVNWTYGEVNKDEWWATTIVVEYERARGAVEKDGRPKGYSICSTKTIAAAPETVSAAWLDAKQLSAWFGDQSRVDARVDGKLGNEDGDAATFTKIRAGKDLRLGWENPRHGPPSVVEVLFQPKGEGKTGVVLNHTRIEDRKHADELRLCWGQALERLKALLEGGKAKR